MIVLDTDTLTLYFVGHPRVTERFRNATDEVVTTIISRIEVLRGRFESLLKSADGDQLLESQRRLTRAEFDVSTIRVLPIDDRVAFEFDRLRAIRRLRRIGRADLLIASIVLAQRATLVTRNRRHFDQVPGLNVEDWAA